MRLEEMIVRLFTWFLCFEIFMTEGRTLVGNDDVSPIVRSKGGAGRFNLITGKPLLVHPAGIKLEKNGPKRGSSGGTFNVMNYGARANGRTDDSQAFASAWKDACDSTGKVIVFVPKGKYLLGPVKFLGPCENVTSITLQMQGTLLGSDLRNFGSSGDWVQFGWLDGLTLTGGGTFDGQGAKAWPFNKCPTKKNCQVLPANLRFVNMNRTRVDGIKSVNSKFFHMILQGCSDFQGRRIRITAPDESPNTDGIHIEESNDVTIANTVVGTGDDCISIGQGNTGITLSGITCGPGHGISVGSLGRYPDEADVKGLIVKDSTLTGTMNGVRIKTWENSPVATAASNMTFENIKMKNVGNPIIIDQTYCPFVSCSSQSPSRVKISDISFRNIRGTTSSPVAVTLDCSKGIPCQGINLDNVHLTLVDQKTSQRGQKPSATAFCQNVKAKYTGTQFPPPCK